jgi:arsenate reductase-like glutaredoxin family protein
MDNRLERYAEWLVANQNKKGSPEWDTVSNAYKQLRQGAAPIEPPKEDLDSSILDIPVSLSRGAVQGVRFLADAFGADNPVSNALRGTENYLADLMSAQAKADSKEISRIMKEAEDKGVGDQVMAAIKALSIAPVDLLTQALGTAAPTIVGGLAGLALKGGATAATAIGSGIGAGMGAGVVKSTIYDAVEDALIEAGEKPEVAKAKAEEAQEYTGDNWGSILAGTALGGLAGVTGIEKNIVGRFAAKQAAKETAEQTVAKEATEQTIVGAAAREAAPEAAQAGQEQLAANLALQGEIDPRTNLPFDVPTFRGVAGQAALEGLLGAGLGAGVEVAGRVTEKPEPAPPSTEEEREAFERELTPEEQLKAQLARQQAGQQILEGIKQDVGTDLDQLDADTQAAVDEYEKAKPKPTRKKISLKEQAADREAYEKGDMSLAEFTAKYEGADLESTDTGVGLEGGEQATGAPDTTGAETPDATGVAGVDESVTPAGTGEGATSTAIDPVVVVKNSEENLQQKNDKKAEIQQKLAAAKAKKKDVAAGKLPIGAEDFDYEIGQLESELAKVEDETSMIETYETVRQTLGKSEKNKPWEDLSADERMVYEDALGKDIVYGLDQEPDVVEEFESKTKEELEGELGRRRAAKTQRLKDKTAEELEDIVLGAIGELTAYRKAKGEGKGLKNTAIAAYEINRKAESNYRGLDLPRWTVLPEEAKQAFLDKVFSPNESSPSYAGPSYEIQQEGFDAIQEIVGEQLASRRPELEETARQQESEAAAQQRAQMEMEEEQLSLGQKLPEDIVSLIKNASNAEEQVQAQKQLLEYLRKNAVGISKQGIAGLLFDKASSRLNRVVAGSLAAIDLKTKIVYVDTNDFIAEYDARTDTIRIGNRGLNETAVLHELVHAGTVKTIFDVLSGKEKDPVKVEAVRRLDALMKYSKKTLGGKYQVKDGKRVVVSEGYNRAFQNIYEFVAYAMSDPKFQTELQKITVPKNLIKYSDVEMEPVARAAEARDAPYSTLPDKPESLYTAFVQTVADIVGLFSRVGTLIKTLGVPKEFFDRTRRKSTKEIEEDIELTDEEKQRIVEDIEKREKDPEYRKLKNKLGRVEKIEFGYVQRKQKLVDSLIAEATKGLKKEQAEKINEFSPQVQDNPEYKKAVADIKRQQKNITAARKEIEDAGFDDLIPGETTGDQKYGVMVSTQPGALGNLFLELAGIFDTIIAAPPEGGIFLFENSPDTILPMAGGKPGAKPKPLPKISADQAAAEAKTRLIKKTEEAETGAFKQFGRAVTGIFTKQGYTNLVRKVQNRLVDFQNKERELDRLGKLVMVGTQDEVNDINTKYNSAMGIAQNKSNLFKEFVDEAIDSVRLIMKATKKSYAETLADLQMYMTGLHDMERRLELFYRNVPLTDAALTERIRIYEELSSKSLIELRNKNQRAADTIVRKLKQRLVKLTTDPSNYPTGIDAEKLTPGGYMYNPLGYDIDVANKFKGTYKNASPEVKAELEKLFGTDSKPGLLKQVIDKSAELNREANYFTNAVENVIKFYGYKHYFPFKGRGDTDTASKLDMADPFVSDRLGGDFKQGETTFMGRQSDADNPFLQVFTEATKSAMRAGFKDVPHTMKNLINKKEVAGKLKKTITFQERSAPGFKWSEAAGQNDFFVYKADGSVDIYEINDPNMRRAFKGLYKTEQPMVELANKVTSTIGSFHTRYNPAFAPLDFVRNLMTYVGIVGLRFGPKTAAELYAAMGKVVAQGGMHKTFVFTRAFNQGDVKKLAQLEKSGDSFYKDVARYYELGGQVAYMDSLTNSQALESLGKELQRDPRFSPKKWATYFDSWMSMFETTSRIATYRTLKEKFIAEKVPEAEAEQRAMSIAKDLANFQQVGEIGKELGSLFMFWRPAATGAVKAIDALIPAFDLRSRDDLVKLYKTKPNTTDTQAQRAADVYLTEVKNARVMSTVLAGAGFFTYTMAHMMGGEDDEGRNKAETDDMARWVRFARFNLGTEVTGRDLVFQVPWGFGPGAIASAGAQMAAVAYGGQDLMRAGLNITSAGFESFVPLPISKIDPIANPTLFVVDSVMPSVLRPLLQFAANTDGLGRKIYTDRQSRYADAYLGGDNVPAMYKDAVRFMFEATDGMVDMSPGTAYFLANNYVDGASRVLATTYNLTDVIRGQKEFDIRTDSFLLDSYFKAPANYDAIQFSKAENKIKELDKRIKALQNTPQFGDFLEDYPMAPGMVNFYNKVVNGALRNLRTQANQVRRSDMSQKEKNDMLQMLNKQQNQIKRAFLTAIEGLETGYTGYEE